MRKVTSVAVLSVILHMLVNPIPTAHTERVATIPTPVIVATTFPLPLKVSSASSASRSDEPKYIDMGYFVVTAYTAGVESTGKRPGDRGYGITATGTHVQEGRTISADWRILPIGTRVRIEGLPGIYTVEDSGSAIKRNHIDLFVKDLKKAKAWGRQTLKVEIVK